MKLRRFGSIRILVIARMMMIMMKITKVNKTIKIIERVRKKKIKIKKIQILLNGLAKETKPK